MIPVVSGLVAAGGAWCCRWAMVSAAAAVNGEPQRVELQLILLPTQLGPVQWGATLLSALLAGVWLSRSVREEQSPSVELVLLVAAQIGLYGALSAVWGLAPTLDRAAAEGALVRVQIASAVSAAAALILAGLGLSRALARRSQGSQ